MGRPEKNIWQFEMILKSLFMSMTMCLPVPHQQQKNLWVHCSHLEIPGQENENELLAGGCWDSDCDDADGEDSVETVHTSRYKRCKQCTVCSVKCTRCK
ncbi:hypothetical protein PR048_016019 [Dryococelus australis]|uniref:Uncharacterized protein n=1 Tax=Dryococelus australis TaxID=614101 RepID=A0ABQ9HIK4_9NEOP|nr:hypothetical protein PR048_016019 [Dryococelus australis]